MKFRKSNVVKLGFACGIAMGAMCAGATDYYFMWNANGYKYKGSGADNQAQYQADGSTGPYDLAPVENWRQIGKEIGTGLAPSLNLSHNWKLPANSSKPTNLTVTLSADLSVARMHSDADAVFDLGNNKLLFQNSFSGNVRLTSGTISTNGLNTSGSIDMSYDNNRIFVDGPNSRMEAKEVKLSYPGNAVLCVTNSGTLKARLFEQGNLSKDNSTNINVVITGAGSTWNGAGARINYGNTLVIGDGGTLKVKATFKAYGTGNVLVISNGVLDVGYGYNSTMNEGTTKGGNTSITFEGTTSQITANEVYLRLGAKVRFTIGEGGRTATAIVARTKDVEVSDDVDLIVDAEKYQKEGGGTVVLMKAETAGKKVVLPDGLLARWQAAMPEGCTLSLSADAMTVAYDMPRDGFVALGVFDKSGKLLRQLLKSEFRAKGANSEPWDGKDQYGKLVAPGDYVVKAIVTDEIKAEYKFSMGNPGNPPWSTADGSGDWLSDEAPAQGVATDGENVYIVSPGSEKGYSVMKVDGKGNKCWGVMEWIYPRVASVSYHDGKVYVLFSGPSITTNDSHYNGKNATGRDILICYDAATGKKIDFSAKMPWTIIAKWPYREEFTPVWEMMESKTFAPERYIGQPRYWAHDIGETCNALGLAVTADRIAISKFYEDVVEFYDKATLEKKGEVKVAKPVGLFARKDGTIFAVSGKTVSRRSCEGG